MHKGNVSESRVTIDENLLQSCSVQMLSFNFEFSIRGIHFGNSYGGAVSLYYGLEAVDSLVVQNARSAFVNNECRSSSITNSVGTGGNAYGGCLSVYVGPWNINLRLGTPNKVGSLSSSMQTNISGNTITNCSAQRTSPLNIQYDPRFGDPSSKGANVYGGGISVAVGAYSYSDSSSIITFSGSTTVSNTSYTISSNTLTNCNATSSVSGGGNSFGANVYGGGISVAVGAYSYSGGGNSGSNTVSGSTTVSTTSYAISSNTLINCNAASSASSGLLHGANVYGGGIAVAVGVYSYVVLDSVTVSGSTTVSTTSYTISSNTLINCNAASSVSRHLLYSQIIGSVGSNVYGGGISVAVGPNSYSWDFVGSSTVSGSTMVSSTSYTISSNTLANCNAASSVSGGNSYGANVYGGCISVAVGAYSCSWSIAVTATNPRISYVGISSVSGSTTVSNTSYTISSNMLTNCNAVVSMSGRGDSNGANVYGGGISVAVGAYSYSFSFISSSSSVSGSTTVSNTSYTISSDTLTNCNASSVSSSSSLGANVYGGGISVAVGAYSYSGGGNSGSTVSGSTTVSSTSYTISSNILTSCSALSRSTSTSNGASSYGGAVSLVHNASSFPLNTNQSVAQAVGFSSAFCVYNCSFYQSNSATSSESCASGTSNAAGGAVFALVPSLTVDFFSNSFSNSSASVQCSAFASSTYSLGGGMSIFQAGNVKVTSTNFTGCFAQGVRQSTNVFVSGGGLHIQASDSFVFQNGSITDCSVRNAFSTFLQNGGGAFSTQNVSNVQISDSIFRDNSDLSSSGSILLQQLEDDRGMNVTMDRSHVLNEPSNTPALNISCGSNCSQAQQQRIYIRFQNFNITAYSETKEYDSSAMMSLPVSSVVDSDRYSSLKCLFNFTNNGAILITVTGGAFSTFSCAPCAKSFEIAQTSRAFELKNFQNVTNLGNQLCQSIAPRSTSQQCPYGVPFCSTIVNVSVGVWATFSADGKFNHASPCPRNYCGCNNVANFTHSSCLLEPPFSPTFQPDVRTNDNLCRGNRCGVLCGGCKSGFTQSLDGYSCISNDECEKNVGWVWAVSIVGYLFYGLYIVISALKESDGLISCLLYYGQMSSFASVSRTILSGPEARSSEISEFFSRFTQFNSIVSVRSQTCYGIGMGAYETTAAHLSGSALVLLFAIAISLCLKRAKVVLLRHEIDITVSIPATIASTVVLIFSNVVSIAILLITCVNINGHNVVFIDGSVKCNDEKWRGLVAVVVLLCCFPPVLAFALRRKRLPHNVQAVLCGSFVETRFYWSAVSLFFRFFMSGVSAFSQHLPTTAATVQCVLCVAMIVILTYQKPYRYAFAYHFDVFCHFCLAIQYVLESLLSLAEASGAATADSNPQLFDQLISRAAQCISALR
jgi:hypothetical protein